MRHLVLLSTLGLLALSACAEMSGVPESAMQQTEPDLERFRYYGERY